MELFNKRRHASTEAKNPTGSERSKEKAGLADLFASDNPYLKQALIELVASDVPLDPAPEMRRAVANELARLYEHEKRLCESERANQKWRKQTELETAQWLQDQLENVTGLTTASAKQAAAEMIGLPSADALRKRRERARKRKQDKR